MVTRGYLNWGYERATPNKPLELGARARRGVKTHLSIHVDCERSLTVARR
jgi:hypothetical protein